MKFRFGTKEHTFFKVVADPDADEEKWLPACEALGDTELAKTNPVGDQRSPVRKIFSGIGALLGAIILICGQVFMVSGAAVSCGTFSSGLGGLSFNRIMYHCGPQDTYLGIFVLAAVPVFWYAWYQGKARYAKFALLPIFGICTVVGLIPSFSAFGCPVVFVGLVSLLLLTLLHFAGVYSSSLKMNWPRKFSVTRWLSICYVPAALLLWYEFGILDMGETVDKVSTESMLTSAGIIAAFSLLPAFLTALDSRSRQFASGFGLSAIGQLPVLTTMLVYFIANAVMLTCVSLLGTTAVADYFSRQATVDFSPDFDTASTYMEVLSKCLSSLLIWAVLLLSVWGGSTLGVLLNRWRGRSGGTHWSP